MSGHFHADADWNAVAYEVATLTRPPNGASI
jgi:hypothetical protein